MSTILLSPAKADMWHGAALKALYLEGECYAFAIAVHRGTGWPMVGLIKDGIARHALIRQPDGRLFDARGVVTDEELGEPFSMSAPYEFRNITEQYLYAIRPVTEISIRHARLLAEELWPDVPWDVSEQMKVRAFTDALENLCRQHGFWIRASIPGSPPLLERAHGDEGGYTIQCYIDGVTYVLNRYLENDYPIMD